MATKPQTVKPKLTDAERHKRFVEVAKKIGASEDIADFDKAFVKIAKAKSKQNNRPSG
jgi:hypothetical protein